jgi:hypothetical protein
VKVRSSADEIYTAILSVSTSRKGLVFRLSFRLKHNSGIAILLGEVDEASH